MASTYTTGFSIEKIGSGEQAGSWGTTSNHNWDIVDRLASYKAVALSDASTATLTVREASPGSGTENLQDGMYRAIKFTGSLSQDCTVTIAPNTAPAWFIIENAAGDDVILSQGSGANVTVQNGKNVIVYCDGAGGGAAVVDALADLQIGTLEVTGVAAIDGALTQGGASQFNSTVTVGVNDTGYDVKLFGATSGRYWLWDESADGVVQLGTLTVGVDDTGHDVKFFGATSGAYMLWDESADDLKLVGAAGLTVAGDIDVDGTTNLDAVDIDGATQIDGTVTVGVDDTGYDVKMFGATSGAYMLWDESADDLILAGAAGLSVAGTTATAAITASGIIKTDDTTAATSTTDGSLQTDGGLSVVLDAVIGDDLFMLSDGAVITFGADKDVTLTHVADSGLALKHSATADDKPINLVLQTGETDIAANDVIGKISFQAPDEAAGTDAILISGAIQARSEGDFSASSNATSLDFMTGASAAATTKLTLASDGDLTMPNVTSSTQTAFRPPFIDFQIASDNPSGVNKGIYWHSVTASAVNRSYGAIWRDQASGNLHIDSQTNQVFSTTTSSTERMSIASAGTVNVVGTFTAGTKTFRIDHPLPAKNDTHYLLHSSIEGPQADLIYRGRADLVSGVATVNIDTVSNMTDGTFVALCSDVQCFTSNEDGWTALKGSVAGNILTITAQDNACTDTVSWMVIGERKDAKMIESEWADDDGKLIVETLKSAHDESS